MHDLQTINRLNATAFAESVKKYQDQGRHVVATYNGLALVSFETFTDHAEAQAAFNRVNSLRDSSSARLFFPTPTDQVIGQRDQSEDRAAV